MLTGRLLDKAQTRTALVVMAAMLEFIKVRLFEKTRVFPLNQVDCFCSCSHLFGPLPSPHVSHSAICSASSPTVRPIPASALHLGYLDYSNIFTPRTDWLQSDGVCSSITWPEQERRRGGWVDEKRQHQYGRGRSIWRGRGG